MTSKESPSAPCPYTLTHLILLRLFWPIILDRIHEVSFHTRQVRETSHIYLHFQVRYTYCTTHAQRERERELDIDKDVKSPLDFKLIKKMLIFYLLFIQKSREKQRKRQTPTHQIVTEWPELLSRL